MTPAAAAQAPRRLGLLLPSSNTVVEPEAARLMPADGSVSLHVSRFRMTVVSDSSESLGQFAPPAMLAAAGLLADAKVDLIAWAGTAASWLGFARDDALIAEIERSCGIAATTTMLAINQQLSALGACSIGLVTPYIAALEARIVANYAMIGIETRAAERFDLTENTDYAKVTPDQLAERCRRLAPAMPDAIIILCTNLRGAPIVTEMSRELGIPVIDSVKVTIEHCLRRLPTALDQPASAG